MEPSPSPTYASFLRVDDLLSLQPASEAHDELLFVVIHQSHELWFKVVLHEIDRACERLGAGDLRSARAAVERMAAVWRALTASWDVLDTLSPAGYLEFRDGLGTGSGFQSVQFREIEIASGRVDTDPAGGPWQQADDRARLARRRAQPSLRDLFLSAVEAAGCQLVDVVRRAGVDAELVDLVDLADALSDYDGAVARWRDRHVIGVERAIGDQPGTGGSSGTAYLRSTTGLRFFPELAEARSRL